MAKLELFGTARCPHTQEMREWLEWKRSDFVEYDVEADPEARHRMSELAAGTTQRARAGRRWQSDSNRLAGPQLHGGCGITMASACSIRVRGVVQGVGFRPFVYRLARANTLAGWVLNGEEGVEIYLEGAEPGLRGICSGPEDAASPGSQHRGNRSPSRSPGRSERIHHSRERAARAAYGSHFARPACLRCLLERTLRSS